MKKYIHYEIELCKFSISKMLAYSLETLHIQKFEELMSKKIILLPLKKSMTPLFITILITYRNCEKLP